MSSKRQLTAIIEREGDGHVALCPELDPVTRVTRVTRCQVNLPQGR